MLVTVEVQVVMVVTVTLAVTELATAVMITNKFVKIKYFHQESASQRVVLSVP